MSIGKLFSMYKEWRRKLRKFNMRMALFADFNHLPFRPVNCMFEANAKTGAVRTTDKSIKKNNRT